ncbi:HAMP domain-containing sensor histidine kinase [Actinomadura parmotrematis]|uniref:histidine kinase n=1 Tax=Actinomadura parmotrematis TaxID=2864039 RepID=A0ABS7FU72_9ACTN|nr:HAMP domain-containing sensor histidine kinase [Actinomadura parmotrematis]MBW8483962.1 HAMP domain-containing histidine kinase [Actinomadura parmotrematis]
MGDATGVPLRRRLLVTIAGVTTLAVVLLTLTLAVAVQRLYRSEAVATLERDAARVAATAPDDIAARPRPVALPEGLSGGIVVGIYRADGARLTGDGPAASPVAAATSDGRPHQADEAGVLAVTAPIPSDEGRRAVVRVGMPDAAVARRTDGAWLLMAAFALVVIGLAVMVARSQSRRLALPLERLTGAAQALGDGDFSVRAQRSGIREADEAGRALEVTARRLGTLLDRERAFSADVSHQLRTPLTGLLLGLEAALERPGADLEAAARTAVRRGEHLRDIIDDLLRLARDAGPDREPLDVPALLAELEARREDAGRPLTVRAHGPLPVVHATTSAVRQILEVLVDNAVAHGGGRITVEASDIGGGLAVDVSDEGPGVVDTDAEDIFERRRSAGPGYGIGLALARSLAEAEGGRLVLRRLAPPIFTLLLPAAERRPERGDASPA